MSTSAELVRLEIPARPAFVGVARTVMVAIAASVSGIDDDRLEDLRIAVSEACTNAVAAHRAESDHRIELRCTLDDAALEISIDASSPADEVGRPDEPASDPSEPAWGVQLIQALVDDVSFDGGDAGSSVRLTMHRLPHHDV